MYFNDKKVMGLSHDSTKVKAGDLFFALKGGSTDGKQYITEALSRGAIGIIEGDNAREQMSLLAKKFYNNACDKLKIIGITGTNGKTTTSHMIAHILRKAGKKVGLIGTLGASINGKPIPSTLTTPDPIELHSIFHQMAEQGVTHVVMECSAHAIHLKKLAGIMFEVGIFTNLSQDHLDFFKSYKHYCDTKTSWFRESPINMRFAVANTDDEEGDGIFSLPYSLKEAKNLTLHPTHSTFKFRGRIFHVNMPAEFNVMNALAAIKTCKFLGIPTKKIQSALKTLPPIPGRFNTIDVDGRTVVIDYAHTPDALENILKSARKICKGKLISIFGCGGDRDKSKRPLMGEISGKLADKTIITSDNPRSEEPEQIAKQIAGGVCGNFIIEVDRKKAIHHAISISERGDIIVIAGKGAENYMEIKGKKVPYSDYQVVNNIPKPL